MKREGRQHGMVRTHPILPQPFNPRPVTGYVNELCSPPTAGVFAKVSSKPTNHSKFTGKCGRPRSHVQRISKAKGAQKIVWRVVDANPGFKLSDSSASDVLDQLIDADVDEYYDDDMDDNLFEEKVMYGYEVLYGHHWTATRFGSSWEECNWSSL